jgi:hypothetical protein
MTCSSSQTHKYCQDYECAAAAGINAGMHQPITS